MNKDFPEQLRLMSELYSDLNKRLEAIEETLGSVQAQTYSDDIKALMVDDVLRCNMMMADIMKYATAQMTNLITKPAFKELMAKLVNARKGI
jgi:hypothetical protein